VVVSESVTGEVTLVLKDVPWDQALDIIMKQKNLGMRVNGNVILIAPRDELAVREREEYETLNNLSEVEPLLTESFQMNYIKAEAIQKLLSDEKQRLLSKRGSANTEERSNILFVRDTPSRLEEIRLMIAKVDVPSRQVMIEARIVEAGDSFAKNLGVRMVWNQTDRSGAVTVGGGQNFTGQLNSASLVNLPATPRAGTPGSMLFTLFNTAQTQFLNLEVSALEADGRGKVISSPRVMTANQVKAKIEQGVEIPYQQATSSGATSVSFRKANLALEVTPQITPDGKVHMKLKVNKDTPNTRLSTGAGVAIDTKQVETEVLVENGGTVVIGGIYTQEVRNNTTRIPFFGDLPYIGFLFKNREWIDDKTELLVFVTPRIVAESLSVR
jgi:type IV pilus assembly protein PilQ